MVKHNSLCDLKYIPDLYTTTSNMRLALYPILRIIYKTVPFIHICTTPTKEPVVI